MLSVFEIYSIGIGPSSSHTVGPMRAADKFIKLLKAKNLLKSTQQIQTELYGSLALTGVGHGTDKALMLGFCGESPEEVEIESIDPLIDEINQSQIITMASGHQISFQKDRDIVFHRTQTLPEHPNGMCFQAIDKEGRELFKKIFFSIGGGFIAGEKLVKTKIAERKIPQSPFPFKTAEDLLVMGKSSRKSISQMVWENELTWKSEKEIHQSLTKIWKVMQKCIKRGLKTKGQLPGGLKIKRRAPKLYRKLHNLPETSCADPLSILDWVNLYALAVNEENAAGGKVVTAPTNGAAGIIPAVLHYYVQFCFHKNKKECQKGIHNFLLTAGAIAILYKYNASISGADVGCQGEVGVACSMAAGALTEILGGSIAQVENAAEIAMEHNLGLTCDPVGGLVQVPCIERNAMGAIKAINASRMALRGDGTHFVSLDQVIKTMYETGKDMQSKYKETSRGGLAVNIIEC